MNDQPPEKDDPERNRLSGRVKRYAKVGTDVGGVAARLAGQRVFGGSDQATADQAKPDQTKPDQTRPDTDQIRGPNPTQ